MHKSHSVGHSGPRRGPRSAWYSLPVALLLGSALLFWIGAPMASHAVFLVAALGLVWLVERSRPDTGQALGLANQVTLARALLALILVAALAEPGLFVTQAWFMVGLALLLLLLDGVDGWLARRFRESSAFGARFDMEVDAGLIMTLCLAIWLSGQAAAWVLLIGAMRYAFVAAAAVLPWLGEPLPERFRRKLVCVVQVVALLLALAPILGSGLQAAVLAVALISLLLSFGADVNWLYRHRQPPTASTSRPPIYRRFS